MNITSNIRKLNRGSVTTYALYITTGIVLYMTFSSYVHVNILLLSLLLGSSLLLNNNKSFNCTISSFPVFGSLMRER